jgi:uncharacterized protein (DUF433 family)
VDFAMDKLDSLVSSNPEIMGGQLVFKGTRVSVESLFDYLESGQTLQEFLDDFPSVSNEQAAGVIEIAGSMLLSGDIRKFYESAT